MEKNLIDDLDTNKMQNELDNNYIHEIKKGNVDALNKIMEKYKAYVYLKAKPFFLAGAEKEDIIQEGMIGLFTATQGYDCTTDVSFTSSADSCIKRQIMTAIKTSTRQKHIPLNSYVSLNKTAFDEDDDRAIIEMIDTDSVPDPLETVTTKEKYQKIGAKMTEVLSDFEQKVFSEYINGDPYIDIAKKITPHPKAVDNAVQRIKKKFEKYILDDEK